MSGLSVGLKDVRSKEHIWVSSCLGNIEKTIDTIETRMQSILAESNQNSRNAVAPKTQRFRFNEYSKLSRRFINLSIKHPDSTKKDIQGLIKKFITHLCLENTLHQNRISGGTLPVIVGSAMKHFFNVFDFTKLLTPANLKFKDALDLLKSKMQLLILNYCIYNISLDTLRILDPNFESSESNEWLKRKFTSFTKEKPALISLGWRLPQPYLGHEIIGYIKYKNLGKNLVLKIVDTSETFMQEDTRLKPSSVKVNIPDLNSFIERIEIVSQIQFTKRSEKLIQYWEKEKLTGEDKPIPRLFRDLVYTALAGDSILKSSIKNNHCLSYYDYQSNRGCGFNFLKPLMYVIMRDIIKEKNMPISSSDELILKNTIDTLYLNFKTESLTHFSCLFEKEELSFLEQQVRESRKPPYEEEKVEMQQ